MIKEALHKQIETSIELNTFHQFMENICRIDIDEDNSGWLNNICKSRYYR